MGISCFNLLSIKKHFLGITSIFFILTPIEIYSQNINLEQFYTSSKLPEELNVETKSRLEKIYKEYLAKKNVVIDDDKMYKDFVYKYNYSLDRLNKSGKIFFENEITDYLNTLKNRILENYIEKDFIKIYITNSSELNAFTNDFGNIYVNIGTVAKLESEGELLAILAHEISHVLLEHSFKIENLDNRFTNDKKTKNLTQIDVFSYHSFSRTAELEADSMAIILLNKIGVKANFFQSALNKLKNSENLDLSGDINTDLLFFGNNDAISYFDRIMDVTKSMSIEYELNQYLIDSLTDERLFSHPNIDDRIVEYKKHLNLIEDSLRTKSGGSENGFDFSRLKRLASYVYLKTLMDEGDYIKGIYLVLSLRNEAPFDEYLIKTQLKLMLLLTQQKYGFELTQFAINPEGDACNQENLLQFRSAMTSVPALEMNILTHSTLNEVKKQNLLQQDTYFGRMELFCDLFLYKNNPNLFKGKNNRVEFDDDLILSKDSLSISKFMSEYDKKRFQELVNFGYKFVNFFWLDTVYVQNYITEFSDFASLNEHIAFYKNQRNQFENTLTIDQFEIKTNPKKGFKEYRHGVFMFNDAISDSAKIYLVNSDNYFLKMSRKENSVNIRNTIELNHKLDQVTHEDGLFDGFATNLSTDHHQVSTQDNYEHYAFCNYVDQCWQLSDLIYTTVDEEILNYRKKNNVNYIAYLLNICGNKRGKRAYGVHYSIYIDLNSSGVIYISKVGSKSKHSKAHLRHYIYTGYYGNK